MDLKEAIKVYKSFLKAKGLLYTLPRERVLKEAVSAEQHFSADDLTLRMNKRRMGISRATVYRTLASIKDAGILNSVDLGHGHIHYEASKEKRRHEHITCERCGAVCEMSAKSLSKAISSSAAKANFSDVKYVIRISGVCAECRKA